MLRGISRYLASGIPYGYQRGSVVPRVCARAFTTESPFKEPKKNTQDTAPEEVCPYTKWRVTKEHG